ncbi:MAG: ATP-binding cassette domain-containing protein [Acetobacteraceae bacterium]|nr:ATP-binding cassette domain-containing protein [Acetobacteraceae bacterium]
MIEPKRTKSIASLRLMLPYLRPYLWRVAGASVALLMAAGLVLGLGQGVRMLIDQGFGGQSLDHLNQAAAIMFATVATLAAATFCRFYLVSWLGERVAGDLRRDVFNKVLTLAPDFFETARTGDILSRMTADVSVLQALIGSSVSMWLRSAVTLIGALAMLVVTSPKLAGLVLLVVPFVVVPIILFGRRERRLSRIAQDRVADLGAYAEEAIGGLRTVQAYTHEAIDRLRFGEAVERSVATAVRRILTRASLILVVILLGFGAITLSLWVGGRDVITGQISGGDLAAFVFYAVMVASSGATMSELWGEVQRAAGAADRIIELLDEVPTIAAPVAPAAFPAPVGRIEFDRVGFRYPARPDTAALADFSLTVEPGEMVALVGPSGAGKTTVLQLLLRFYDPQSGAIRVDGTNIAAADPTALRQRIGLVAQDPVIFSANAWENIRYGRPDATDAEVRAAAHAAAADFLDDLPEGFDTFLGEKGVRLSGGQRQRIAIARAILRDAPILLLDEATSALDAEAEAAVQHALSVLATGRTTLVVAHRLATIRRANRIVVIEAGRVVATGTHDELVREGGLYARLAALQFDLAT